MVKAEQIRKSDAVQAARRRKENEKKSTKINVSLFFSMCKKDSR